MTSMKKQFFVVTGCDSGFGYDLVSQLVEMWGVHEYGPIVIACCHKASSLAHLPVGVIGTQLDITKADSVSSLKQFIEKKLLTSQGSSVIGLVNNAGALTSAGPLEFTPVECDIAQMDLNFYGTVRVTKALLPFLRLSRGRIVNVSSITGFIAAPLAASYSASKFALEGWSDALRREMLPFGVTVHIVEPGMVQSTKFYHNYLLSVDSAWENAPNDIKIDYGDQYRNYCKSRLRALRNLFASNTTRYVVDSLVHALTSKSPKHRYRVGWDSYFLGRVLELLPTSLADVALTASDSILVMNSGLMPVAPNSGRGLQGILITAFFGYQQRWAAVCLCFLDRKSVV